METLVAPSLIAPPTKTHQSHHHKDNHLLVFEGGKFSYVSVPPLLSLQCEEPELCFTDHNNDVGDPRSEQCCLREGGHIHAHVHRGEILEEVLLEECMDEAGCALPMPWDLPGPCFKDLSDEKHHLHKEDCGHDQIAHGDHLDWLVPMSDGSFMLSHAYVNDDGASQFIRHGCLVKVGESYGRLKKCARQLFDLFSYEVPQVEVHDDVIPADILSKDLCSSAAVNTQLSSDSSRPLLRSFHLEKRLLEEGTVKLNISSEVGPLQRTTIDVLGICCPAEVPLVKKILETLPGVQDISVNVVAKTVTVCHDPLVTSAAGLVKCLNDARLEASIHHPGEWKAAHKWPSPYTFASGLLVAITFFHYIYSPLRWVGLGAVAVGIPPIILRSMVSLRSLKLDINVLMLIAVGGAVGLGDYLEAGSIVFLFTLADWLESRSSDKARLAISSVASLAPQIAVLADNGMKVPVSEVETGTKLSVKAGELIPIDGIVIFGKSLVDESSLTGESLPVEKEAEASVWAGTMNMAGFICVETTSLAEDSAVSRMVRLVEEAQTQRSHMDLFVDKFAKYYTPVVVIVALAVATIPLSVHAHNIRHWLYLALVLLVVACPCALVISTPITTTCAIARAARMGLIVKGGSSLEALAKLKVVAMDKTGTLTEGLFQVAQVWPLSSSTGLQKLLYWVACIESKSNHPMASALVAHAKLHGIEPSGDVEDFTILAGEGVSGTVDGHKIHIGNDRLASQLLWTEAERTESRMLDTWRHQGWTISWVGVDGRPVGILCAGDQLRPEALEAVSNMRNLGLRIAMLTGDSVGAANAACMKLGEIEVHAQLLPEDKVEVLKQLKKLGLTGMVGDGINDAPALAAADVGIAMGVAGSAVAMETADIALMTNDLRKLAAAMKLSRRVHRKIQQNVLVSVAVKVLVIALAIAGCASLWGAVLADMGSCLVVIFNSMLLLGRDERGISQRSSSDNHSHHYKQTEKSLECRASCSGDSVCCKSRKDEGALSPQDGGSCVNTCVSKPCCQLNGKSSSRIRKRLCLKDDCSKGCQDMDCCSTVLTISQGGASCSAPRLPNSSVCCKPRKDEGVVSLQDCSYGQDHLGNCCMAKECCEVNGQSSSSGIIRRLCQKDTCLESCHNFDCSCTSGTISEAKAICSETRLSGSSVCCKARKNEGVVRPHDSLSYNDHQEVQDCHVQCGVEKSWYQVVDCSSAIATTPEGLATGSNVGEMQNTFLGSAGSLWLPDLAKISCGNEKHQAASCGIATRDICCTNNNLCTSADVSGTRSICCTNENLFGSETQDKCCKTETLCAGSVTGNICCMHENLSLMDQGFGSGDPSSCAYYHASDDTNDNRCFTSVEAGPNNTTKSQGQNEVRGKDCKAAECAAGGFECRSSPVMDNSSKGCHVWGTCCERS